MVSVNSSGSTTVGRTFSLTCSITRVMNISGNLTIQWIGSDHNQVVSMGPIAVGDPMVSGEATSLSLQFTTLFTSHGGEYRCQGDLMSQDTMYTVSALQDVIIRGT